MEIPFRHDQTTTPTEAWTTSSQSVQIKLTFTGHIEYSCVYLYLAFSFPRAFSRNYLNAHEKAHLDL